MPKPQPKTLEVGDALVAFQTLTTGYGTPTWNPDSDESPTYPDNPYVELPRLLLRFQIDLTEPHTATAGLKHNIAYQYEWLYQRRQTPGQAHHRILTQELQAIRSKYCEEGFIIPQLEAISGFQLESCIPDNAVTFTDMQHPYGDPRLIVSTGRFILTVKGSISAC